ncbi:MAG: PQQ-dependent sugar dehydrogenase [Balneolales bacterium]|nr:PQQ-dependent sugar dehydrogenase [Balneolales bacterium]
MYITDLSETFPQPALWLDISGRLISGGERGLLGLAFPPGYSNSKGDFFYVSYTNPSPLRSVISRFAVGANGLGNPDSEEILLEFSQPLNNHNGGKIVFGPNGYLYISSGYGGGGEPEIFTWKKNVHVRVAKLLKKIITLLVGT